MMRRLLTATFALLTLSACSLPNLGVLPAPGKGTDGTYAVTARFDDTTGLPLGAKVKLDGAEIGRVSSIETKDYVAQVVLRIEDDARLTDRTRLQIRFSTPLGDNFIAATPGEGGRPLKDGSVIDTDRATIAPTIENTFAALSTLVNGGGLDRIGSIVRELNTATDGRTEDIRSVTTDLRLLVSTLNSRSDQINQAIDATADLTATLEKSTGTLDQALTDFPRAARVLADQNERLLALTAKVEKLSRVTDDVLNRGTDVLLDDLRLLEPTLRQIESINDRIKPTLETLVKFGRDLDGAVAGNYVKVDADVTFVFTDALLCPATMWTDPQCSNHREAGR